MRVVIAGSRTITDYSIVSAIIKESNYIITEVVSGTARGVDTLGEKYALSHNIPVKYMPANWSKFGRAAGKYRNVAMAEYADAAIIIWDGESSGTLHMIDIMKRLKKPYYISIQN